MNATDAWLYLVNRLMLDGRIVHPRGQATRELLAYRTFVSMTAPVVLSRARRLGRKFMFAEAAWILSGDNRVSTIASYSKKISDFSDDGIRFFGAYGPPLRDQLGHVVRALRADPESRQAVVTLWRPNPPVTKDLPCTVALQWLIREEQLHCVATMRSSDAWLGWPYDVFNFSTVSLAIWLELGRHFAPQGLGNLYLTAGSQHLYERDANGALQCLKMQDDREDAPIGKQVGTADELIDWLWEMARD